MRMSGRDYAMSISSPDPPLAPRPSRRRGRPVRPWEWEKPLSSWRRWPGFS